MENPQLNGSGVPAERTGAGQHWRRHTILTEAVLEPLYELNRAYLQALARAPRQWHAATRNTRLPDPVCVTLMSLAPERRNAVARCPFSLFSARFHDDELWSALSSAAAVAETDADVPADHAREHSRAFALAALFYVWHLARSNPPAARVVFGMSERTLAVFRGITLTRVQQIARGNPEIIAPRWPERAALWKALLDAAPRSQEECASEAHLVGLQLIAAELPANQECLFRNPRTSRP